MTDDQTRFGEAKTRQYPLDWRGVVVILTLTMILPIAVFGQAQQKRLWVDRWAEDPEVVFIPQEELNRVDFSALDDVDFIEWGFPERTVETARQSIRYRIEHSRSTGGVCGKLTWEPGAYSIEGSLADHLRKLGLAFVGEVVDVVPGWSIASGPASLVNVEVAELLYSRDGTVSVGDVLTYPRRVGDVLLPGLGRFCTEFARSARTVDEAIGMRVLVVGVPQDQVAEAHIGVVQVIALSASPPHKVVVGQGHPFGQQTIEEIRRSISTLPSQN